MTNQTPYSARAEHHWRTYLPEDYAKIPPGERTAFFARVGAEIEERVTTRAQQKIDDSGTAPGRPDRAAAPIPAGAMVAPPAQGGYMANLAQMMTLRHEAEGEVLHEMLPAPPEDDPVEEDPGS